LKIAFSTLACPDWSLEKAADFAVEAGCQGLELRLLDGELLSGALISGQVERVREVMEARGLAVAALGSSARLAQPDPAALDEQVAETLLVIESAAALHCPIVRVFGGPPAGTSLPDAIQSASLGLSRVAPRAAELGVTACLETHDAFSKGETVRAALDGVVGPGAGAIWDILHPYRQGEAPQDTHRLLGERIAHLHVKDGSRPPEGGSDWPLVPLGEGDVPVETILANLLAGGYDGWLTIEWEKRWHPELADPEIALPRELTALRRMLAHIGGRA
jgi:sugar phosphate isomerase/epimerase